MRDRIHLPGLNGIRAIAAFVVIIHHIGLSLDQYNLRPKEGIDLAGYGVTIFFTLSGFLITYLLLIEKARFGSIKIKQFYIRRILRIWPLYYFYLFLFIFTYLFINFHVVENKYLLFTAFFSANVPFILGVPMGFISHFWSLGVEEQFYLFWPWIVKKVRNLAKAMLVFIAVFLILKIAAWVLFQKTGELIPYMTLHVTRFDCMAIGGYGALLFYQKKEFFLRFFYSLPVQVICWLSLLLLAFNSFAIPSVIKDEVVSVIALGVIVNVSSNPRSIIKLTGKIPDLLGQISYGLYVYHMIVIFFLARWFSTTLRDIPTDIRVVLIYALVIVFTIFISFISYKYFEKWFLVMKKTYTRVESQPGEHL
ncbi:MAG TPA: acyltransferase [Chitinophagaceae bacterium]